MYKTSPYQMCLTFFLLLAMHPHISALILTLFPYTTLFRSVRYSEVDRNKRLDLSSIINYFQDCSTFQSEDQHVGIDFLTQHSLAWMLSSWQIHVIRVPDLGEQIGRAHV